MFCVRQGASKTVAVVGSDISWPNTARDQGRILIRQPGVAVGMSAGREIRLVEEDDGGWSAIDVDQGVASQGKTRQEALENLDEAVGLTKEVRADTDEAPEPDAPWFDS